MADFRRMCLLASNKQGSSVDNFDHNREGVLLRKKLNDLEVEDCLRLLNCLEKFRPNAKARDRYF